jgi:hypothetical protein
MPANDADISSAGHLLGQLVGDWWEQYIVKPLLDEVAKRLRLFCDCRFVDRTCRGEKVQWQDVDGNVVDYDFVLELGGTRAALGVPVMFLECFWRRGARHSKDKARDDTNKLVPMSATYPTARFLSIAACGEFTEPAREYVKSRGVQVFYVPKERIVNAFREQRIQIDYPDTADEVKKLPIALAAKKSMTPSRCKKVAESLVNIVGATAFEAYVGTIIASLSSLPVEIRIRESLVSDAQVFETVEQASAFLRSPRFTRTGDSRNYMYEITYSDGSEFSRSLNDIDGLRGLHSQLLRLVDHMASVSGG